MIEVFCVMEHPGEDDFVFLLRKKPTGEWGGIGMDDSAMLLPEVRKAVGLDATHLWPLCDRSVADPRGEERRDPDRQEHTHLGAVLGTGALHVGDEWAAVPYEDASAMVAEPDRRVLSLARQGAWIHKVSLVDA